VLIAYGILTNGSKVLLHVGVGDRESYEACLGFLREMTERELRPPLLYCSDDCPGLRKALKAVWPKSLPQKCQAHKLRNILGKLPRGVQGEMKKQIHQAFYAKEYAGRDCGVAEPWWSSTGSGIRRRWSVWRRAWRSA
jgi:transposase-like protein